MAGIIITVDIIDTIMPIRIMDIAGITIMKIIGYGYRDIGHTTDIGYQAIGNGDNFYNA